MADLDNHVDKDDNQLDKGKGGGDDFENDLEANSTAFEALERDFQDVNNNIQLYPFLSFIILGFI